MASGADAKQDPESIKSDEWDRSAKAFSTKRSSEYFDPCQEAASRSIKCMHRNNGDKDMCQSYFQAYRECKKLWTEKRKAERGKWFG